MIYSDKNIYDGKYEKGCRNGLGYFIDAETGLASRKLYKKWTSKKNVIASVLEANTLILQKCFKSLLLKHE
jgi:hypothetical protein